MRLTRSVGYAVAILLQIEKDKSHALLTAAKITKNCKFPPRFLYRVLRRLVDAGLLVGTSGPGGGYTLARRRRPITLLDVVNAVESPPEASVLQPVCRRHAPAVRAINRVSRQSAKRFAAALRKITLAKLARM